MRMHTGKFYVYEEVLLIRRAHRAHRATSWLESRRFTPRVEVLDEAAESVVRIKSLALELDARRG